MQEQQNLIGEIQPISTQRQQLEFELQLQAARLSSTPDSAAPRPGSTRGLSDSTPTDTRHAMIDEYLESKVTTATPYQLHLMVIDGAIRHARAAQAALEQKNVREARARLAQSRQFVAEILSGLDEKRMAEVVVRLKADLRLRTPQPGAGRSPTQSAARGRFAHRSSKCIATRGWPWRNGSSRNRRPWCRRTAGGYSWSS